MTIYSLIRRFLNFRINNLYFNEKSKIIFNRNMSVGNVDDSVYQVSFKSCGNVYRKWEKENKFRKLPKGDLEFKVNYVDTRKNISSNEAASVPTVVALHGAPGSYKDYSSLTSYLHGNGVRVVIPNFPDFSTYELGVFRHTDEEKAQFIKDFLKALSIQQVDTLIVHSSATYPGLILCVDNSPLIKSLVMLNPGSFTVDPKVWTTNVQRFIRLLVMSSEIPFIYRLLQFIGPLLLRIIGLPLRSNNFTEPLLSCTAVLRANVFEAKEKFLHLSQNGLPMLYAFSENDKVVGKECAYDLAHLLGCSDADIYFYDNNGQLKHSGKETATLKIVSFENGSHYVYKKYADIINREVGNFVAKL